MTDIRTDFSELLSDPDPVRRAQIDMKKPLAKRFYKEVTVAEVEGGYTIHLDGKPVRTPLRNTLLVPTQAAAEMLRLEWDAQATEINPLTMPVTRLVNTALDGVVNEMDAVRAEILRYAGTDLLCYRASEPEELVALQARSWDPILAWAADALQARLILAQGVLHQEQSKAALAAIDAALGAFHQPIHLSCLHTVTSLTGSALLALAFANRRITAEEAWTLAHVDEDWQAIRWGSDAEAELRRNKRWAELKAASDLFLAIV